MQCVGKVQWREDIMVSMRDASAEVKEEMTEKEMDEVTTVFRSFETGLREATILPKVSCCKM